jgi:hypothetical protein
MSAAFSPTAPGLLGAVICLTAAGVHGGRLESRYSREPERRLASVLGVINAPLSRDPGRNRRWSTTICVVLAARG